MDLNMPYKVKTKDMNFIGYLAAETPNSAVFRMGVDDRYMLFKNEIVSAERLSPRDIETRKNGRYFVF